MGCPSGICHACRQHCDSLLFARWCLRCYREAPSVDALMDASDAYRADPIPAGHKRCSHCREVLPESAYNPSNFVRSGFACKKCCNNARNARRRTWIDPQPRK